MATRNNIDRFFRDQLSDYELSDKKGNWELMNHLLNEQEKRKKRKRVILFILLFLLLSTAGVLLLMPDNNKGEKYSYKAHTEKSINSEKRELNNQKKLLQAPSINQGQINMREKSLTSARENSRQQKNQNILNQSASYHSDEQPSIEKSLHTQISGNNNPGKTTDNTMQIIKSDVGSENGFNVSAGSKLNDSLPSNSSEEKASTEAIMDTTSPPLVIDSMASSAPEILKDDSSNLKPLPNSSTDVYLLAGVNIFDNGRSVWNVAPIGGLELIYSFNRHLAAGLAALYSFQGGYRLDDTVTSVSETYFLEKETSIRRQIIHITKMHKLYFPLTLYYSIAKQHSLLAAVQLSYLLNTTGNYSDWTSITNSTNEKKNVSGYMDGITQTNISYSFGYKFSPVNRIAISIRATRELMDPYEKNYFYGIDTGPSWSFQSFLVVKF